MAFGIGDDLSVRVTADTDSFERGMNSAENSLTGLVDNTVAASSALEFLSNRADDAGDNVRQLGNTASVTAGKITTLSGASAFASASFRGWSATTLTVLLPALAALATTIVPIAATLIGIASAGLAVAGAFGAIVGTGILAFGEERGEQNAQELEQVNAKIRALERLEDETGQLTRTQREQLRTLEERQDKLEDTVGVSGGLQSAFADLREELIPIISEFGEQFIPLIEDAIDAIPDLTQNIIDAVGPVDDFVEALRGFGRVAQREIPRLVSRLADLARRSLPAVIDAGQWLLRNGPDIFEGIIRTTREVAPLLLQLGRAFADILPTINDVGITVLETVVPALDDFLGAIDKLLQGDIQGGLVQPLKDIAKDAVDYVDSEEFKTQLDDVTSSLFNGIANSLSGISDEDQQNLMNKLGSALVDALEILTTNFEESGLAREMGKLANQTLDVFSDELEDYAKSDDFQEDMNTIGGAIAGSLKQAIIDGMKEESIGALMNPLGISNAIARGGAEAVTGEEAPTLGDALSGASGASGAVSPGNPDVIQPNPEFRTNETNVRVRLDDEMLDAQIEEGANRTIEERERRANRNTGGNTTP